MKLVPDKRFLEVPQFCASLRKSKKHSGHSLAFDTTTVWNELPDNVLPASCVTLFRKKLRFINTSFARVV